MRNKATYSFELTGSEPIYVTDVKNYLRIDQSQDDDLLGALITSARTVSEKYLNRLIPQQTVILTLDYLPTNGINLFYGPVQSVTSIIVTDSTGTPTTLDSDDYVVDTAGGRIVYQTDATLPTDFAVANAVTVTYVAGYGAEDGTGVPGGIVQAIRHLIIASYENRETDAAISPLIQALLQPFKKMVL